MLKPGNVTGVIEVIMRVPMLPWAMVMTVAFVGFLQVSPWSTRVPIRGKVVDELHSC